MRTSTLFKNGFLPFNTIGKRYSNKTSSHIWLERQKKDRYVELSQKENYRCRSAFKLIEIVDRFKIIKPGMTVIDVGASPGSWSQVALKAVGPKGTVIAIDKQKIFPIEGVTILGGHDFTLPETYFKVKEVLGGKKADVLISDMAPNATGVHTLDHEKIVELCYAAMRFAVQVTEIGGSIVVKLWNGSTRNDLIRNMKRFYPLVAEVKPEASRSDSAEMFLVGRNFIGIQ